MTTWAKRAKEHFSQKGQNSTTETTETHLLGVLTVQSGRSYEKHDFSQKGQNSTTETTETHLDFLQERQNSTTETTETPLLGVLTVQSGRSYEKHDFSNQAANDPTPSTTVQALPPTDGAVATVRPAGLSPKLLAASLALDALQAGLDRDLSIVASGLPGQEATKPWHHIEASWRELAAVYNQHHFQCPSCIAAGQGRGFRCGTGAALWASYQSQI